MICSDFHWPYIEKPTHSLLSQILKIASIAESTHNVIISSRSKQTTERDDRGETCKVHEKERSNTLDVESIREIAQIPGNFAFDIVDQTTKQS